MTDRRKRRREVITNPTPDQLDEAYEEASKLVKIVENDPSTKAGQTIPHGLLPDVSQKNGDIIQSTVALRIQNLSDGAIADRINTSQPNISRLESKYPDAFAAAEIICLRNAERKMRLNLLGVKMAVTEEAPKMIKVLAELANDPNCKENVRRQAAIDILNLSVSGHSRQSAGGKDRDLKVGAVNFITQSADGAGVDECKIIDVEAVEETS